MPPSFRATFWEELRRRRVVRAVSVYAVVAWVAVQVADIFFPALHLPDWTVTAVAVLALIGFPVTVAVSWIYERTSEGVRKTGSAGVGVGPGEADGSAGVEHGTRFFAALGLGAGLGMIVVGTVFWLAGGVPWAQGADEELENRAIAVLPFEALGTANPAFIKGIHWDVLTRLSGTSGLDVISGSAVSRYAGTDRAIGDIAAELGVGWVLRGEVQQVGDRVQVHARLLDARRERQEWADSWLEELTAVNLFEIQRQITHQIVLALEDQLVPGGSRAAGVSTTDDLEAWRLYVQGRDLLVPRTETSMLRAADYFSEALEADPGYAPAWAGLADALIYLDTFGFELPPGSVEPRAAAERALELDPELAEAHFALANLAHANRNNREAIRRAERAIALRPSYSDAYNLLSWTHKQHGRPQAALENAERAVDLDPTGSAPLSNLVLSHLALGSPAPAAREARRIRDFHPDFSTARFLEALAIYHQGRYREALPLLQDVSVAWTLDGPAATLAVTRVALGDTTGARAALAGIDPDVHPFSVALFRAALGETEAAIEAMAAIDRWDYWATFAIRYFFPDVLRPLRQDPRYGEILTRVDESWM